MANWDCVRRGSGKEGFRRDRFTNKLCECACQGEVLEGMLVCQLPCLSPQPYYSQLPCLPRLPIYSQLPAPHRFSTHTSCPPIRKLNELHPTPRTSCPSPSSIPSTHQAAPHRSHPLLLPPPQSPGPPHHPHRSQARCLRRGVSIHGAKSTSTFVGQDSTRGPSHWAKLPEAVLKLARWPNSLSPASALLCV